MPYNGGIKTYMLFCCLVGETAAVLGFFGESVVGLIAEDINN